MKKCTNYFQSKGMDVWSRRTANVPNSQMGPKYWFCLSPIPEKFCTHFEQVSSLHTRPYRSPKTFSIGLSPKLVNPLDFHQLRWHFVRKSRRITLKITTLGETNSDKIVTCIVTKRGDHTITLIVTNSGRSPNKSPYGVKQKVTKLSHEFSPNTVIIPSP